MRKRLRYGCLIAVMCVGLSGCGSNKTATAETVASSIEEATEAPTTEADTTVAESVETREGTTFRNTKWGDSKEDVKKYENGVLWVNETDDELDGTTIFMGKNSSVGYGFDNDQLILSVVYSDTDYTGQKDLYMSSYYETKQQLKELFGDPFNDDPNNYWTEDKQETGFLGTFWNAGNTVVALGLQDVDGVRHLSIAYMDSETLGLSTPSTEPVTQAPAQSGLRPEFKEAMDSYEEFFNQYADFMTKYKNSNNSADLLSDYMDFMTKYSDSMQKLTDMQNQEMSTEESKYYIDVMARINKKLLEAAQ